MEERGWFSSYDRSSEEKKEKRKEVDLHMVTVETLCISISNGLRGF